MFIEKLKIFVLFMFYKFPDFFLTQSKVLKSYKINYKHTRDLEN